MTDILLIGPWGPAPLAFARSLQRQGIGTYLLQSVAGYAHPDRVLSALRGASVLPAGLEGTPAGVEFIRRYATATRVSAVVPIVDSELIWLAGHRSEFQPGCRVLAPSPESLTLIQSKRQQLLWAASAGCSTLPTHLVRRPDDVAQIPESDYALALRPDRPEAVDPTFKMALARSPAELIMFLSRRTRIDAPIIAQPFRHLPNLIVHGARSEGGDVIASRCFLVPRKFEGISLTIEPWAFPPGLESQCDTFVALAGITGCYHFEFLYSPRDGRAYFLEVNVRLGGTTDKVVRLGFDEPGWLLQAYGIGHARAAASGPTPRRVADKRILVRHAIQAARGRLTEFDYPAGGRLAHIARSCRDLLVARDSIFDWRDVSGSLRFHLR